MGFDVGQEIVIAHGGNLGHPSGGTDRVSAFASGLAERGYDVTIVAPETENELPDRLSHLETALVSTPSSGVVDQPLRALKVASRAKDIATRHDAVVQFEHSTLGGVGQIVGHREYVLDVHDLAHSSPLYGNLPFGSAIQHAVRSIEQRAVRSATEVIAVSEKMKSSIGEMWEIDPERIHVIPNGFYRDDVAPFQDDEPVEGRVVFLGTLHPKVDTESLVSVAERSEVTELVVIGDGPERVTLEENKRARGLETLKVCGRVPDEEAFEIVAKSSLAINPQRPSSLQRVSSPVKLYYYAALGTPMVVSEGPTTADFFADEGAAVVVPSDESFADAVRELLRDRESRREMRRAGKRAASGHSWRRRVNQLGDLYRG